MEVNPEEFRIDPLALEKECFNQPNIMFKYLEHTAECQKAFDEAKAAFDLVTAQCDAEIRKNPAKFGLAKATDKAIESRVVMLARYQQAQRDMGEAKYELGMAKAAITALESKKRGLEKAIDLFLAGYFSEVRTPQTDIDSRETNKTVRRRARKRRAE